MTPPRRQLVQDAVLRLREAARLDRLGAGCPEAHPDFRAAKLLSAELHERHAEELQAELDAADA